MAADTPLNRLTLAATSVADDLGYVALADISSALGTGAPGTYRIIGGHMVTALVARWRLGADLYRETGDTDLGSPPAVIRDHRIVERLLGLGYDKIEGNRFARAVTDMPVQVEGGSETEQRAVIDLLVPAYRTRARQNYKATDLLVTIEVPGLATALIRPPVRLRLALHRLNGRVLDVDLLFPDEVASLVLKAFATRVRARSTDVVDIWRCLEILHAADVASAEFSADEPAEAAAIVRRLFDRRNGPGVAALQAEQRLSTLAADERFTRMSALIARTLGTG